MKLRSLLLLIVVLLFAVPAFAQDAAPTVGLSGSDELGPYLVGPNGLTLYIFTPDPLNKSVCSGQCLVNWPALTVDSADQLTVADGIPGTLGTIVREDDGTTQVTYNGQPLYYWINDAAPGDTTGQAVGRVWWIAAPATVSVIPNDTLGNILVGPAGMTLYIFTNDTPGVSVCSGDCAVAWPPLTVASADDVVVGQVLPGEVGTITRDDGSIQVTYNGWPLYYWKDDKAVGDATGQGVRDVWYVINPENLVVNNSEALGDYLVAGNGFTVYTFANDEAGVSNCADDCAKNWPPVTVNPSVAPVAGANVGGELGTITRDDGKTQLTYNGLPLYYFKEDKVPGDATGQNVGDVWFVVAP
jgi:predicted lipoprotein with Yx(FWY)xxD motif